MKNILFCLFLALPFSSFAQDLFFSWASKDVHYAHFQQPSVSLTSDTTIYAWRGERIGMQAVVYSSQATEKLQVRLFEWQQGKKKTNVQWGYARFVSYVLTNNYQTCGYPPNEELTPYQVADIIEDDCAISLDKGETRPVWCTFDIPRNIPVGIYKTQLELVDSASNKVLKKLNLSINISERTLPSPHEQIFHVDFWQQPYAVSRYHHVSRWSDSHFEKLKPYLRLLARAGQKVVSAILFYEPWGEQSEDKFDPMIKTTLRADGTWTYNYTVFDRWVELCEECGIDQYINCFSMVPWDMTFTYYDEAKNSEIKLQTKTDSKEYEELWTAFLKNFAQHLKEKNWFDKTRIAMDERGLQNMLDAYRIAQNAVPDIHMALAGSYHSELVDKLSDYCIGWGEYFTTEELTKRREKGYISTSYTCCSTPSPNVFSNSLPAEAVYLPLFCMAHDFDGYLHWSWMNWNKDPLHDTRFRMFAPGDTYLIYPGPRSSVRYERFIEGVAQAEKVRLLRDEFQKNNQKEALEKLHNLLRNFEEPTTDDPTSIAKKVNEMETFLNAQHH